MAKRIKFDDATEDQKRCNPGPNVVFNKRKDAPVKFVQYLTNYNREGSLGCGPGKYPMYRDGKYCCEDNIMNDQDLFDYINGLLQSATEMSPSVFQSNKDKIFFLIDECRERLFEHNPTLIDKLVIPEGFTNMIDWYIYNCDNAPDRKTYREIPPEMLVDPQYQRLAGRSMDEYYAIREYRRNLLREANKQFSGPPTPFRPGGGQEPLRSVPYIGPSTVFRPGGGQDSLKPQTPLRRVMRQYRLEVPDIPDEPIIRNRKRDEDEDKDTDEQNKTYRKLGGRKGKTYNKKNKRKKTTKRKTRI
uniref:Uncharacterized protein n=1 Tax=viral metagenome TaxID=1070528 RepID=A0A6C0D7J2_9ZZZZ